MQCASIGGGRNHEWFLVRKAVFTPCRLDSPPPHRRLLRSRLTTPHPFGQKLRFCPIHLRSLGGFADLLPSSRGNAWGRGRMSPAKFYGDTCDVQHPVCRKTQRMIPRNNQGKTDVAAKNLIPEVCPFKKVAARTGRRHRRESFSFAYVCGFPRGYSTLPH